MECVALPPFQKWSKVGGNMAGSFKAHRHIERSGTATANKM